MKKIVQIWILILLCAVMTGCAIRTDISNHKNESSQDQPAEETGAWRKTKEIEYNNDGTVSYRIEYEYDKRGNEIKKSVYDENGVISWWYECEFDENDRIIKAVTYNGDGSIVYITDYAYDEAGNETMYRVLNPDGSIYQYEEFEWNYYEDAPKK